MSARTAIVLILALGLTLASPAAHQDGDQDARPSGVEPGPPPDGQADQPPAFRGRVDLVRVDVMVADRQGRPVTHLTQDDFEVLEEGRPQAIELFQRFDLVNDLPLDGARPSAIRTMADEEMEASRPDVRLIAFFLDDYHVRRTNGISIRDPLVRFIRTQLRPTDMIAVMYPLTPIDEVLFTRDHESVVRAIEGFLGRKYDYTPMNTFERNYVRASSMDIERIRNAVVIDAMTALATRMGALREGRSSIVFVSEGFVTYLPPSMRQPAGMALSGVDPCLLAACPDGGRDDDLATLGAETELMQRMRDVVVPANRGNVAVYGLDPRGSTNVEFDITDGFGHPSADANRLAIRTTQDSLRTIAQETHGRATVNTNSLDAGLSQMLLDASAYYLLGYVTEAPADGAFRRITVRVRERNVDVRARRGFWAVGAPTMERPAERDVPEVATPVQQALASIATAPRADRFVRTWLGVEPADAGGARVRVVWEPMPPVPGDRREAVSGVSVLAFGEGGEELFRGDLAEAPGATAAVRAPQQAVFEAPPGRVDVRFTVLGEGGGTIDENSLAVDVPDLGTGEPYLSTPRVYRGRTVREIQAVIADGEAVPVAAREFSRTERLLIRFDARGGGGAAVEPTAALLNRTGQTIVDLPVAAATAGGTHQVDLGLGSVPAGEYLVELAVEAGGSTATELVAIRIGS